MSRQIIHTERAPQAIGTYSQAVRVGDTVYMSGQVPLDPASMQLVTGDIEAQIRRVFENLKAVAEAAGGSLAQAVKMNVYLTDLKHFAKVNEIMALVLLAALPGARGGRRGAAAAGRRGRDRVHPAPRLKAAAAAAASPAEQRPVTALRGVGAALAERLARLHVTRVADLLFVLPLRYEDRTHVVAIGALTPGTRAAVEGEVQLTEVAYRGRRQLLCRISDGSGMLTLRFFYFSASQQHNLARGTRLRCFGEVRRGPLGLEIVHPEYRRLSHEAAPLEETLTPIYPLTEGVPQGRLRALVAEALRETERAPLRDFLPPAAGLPPGFPSLPEALDYLHRPPREARLEELAAGRHPAQQRLAFEELLAHHLALKLRKRALTADPAFVLTDAAQLTARFLQALPFALTRAQARALAEAEARPRQRRADGAAAAGRCRLRQDGRGGGGGGARGRLGAAGRPDGAHRAAGGAALAQLQGVVRPARGDRGAPVRLAAGAHAPQRARDDRLRARCASWWARTRCFRKASSSPTWRSSSSMSSTASACSSGCGCRRRGTSTAACRTS